MDPEMALLELERRPPDLFTTDLWHPKGVMQGQEVVRRLVEKKVQFPILVISALADMSFGTCLAEECAAQGVRIGLLAKPFDIPSLRRLIAIHVGEARHPEGASAGR